MSNDVVYREITPFPLWARGIMWGALGSAALGTLFRGGGGGITPGSAVGAAAVLGVGGFLESLVGGLLVEVRRDELFFGLGSAKVFRKHVRYEDIERLEPVRYHPLREFGGWGVRGFGDKQAWTARGDQAVVLHLADGRRLYVGSDHPQRLAERIRTVAGTRLGSAPAGAAT